MIDRLLNALIRSGNEAADDVLLEALRLGSEQEKRGALDALLRRSTARGLGGVVGQYDALPEPLQLAVLRNIKLFHQALRECGRSDQPALRLGAMKLIALGRQGKLAYVLSENLHDGNDAYAKAATEAMVALARWVATETRKLQSGGVMGWWGDGVKDDARSTPQGSLTRRSPENVVRAAPPDPITPSPHHPTTSSPPDSTTPSPHHSTTYSELLDQRPEIEAAVARAMDVHRGRHGADLLRAALLLCDWPGSKTLAILTKTKHGGQSPMVRRLQQPPASEHVDAFLLGASHGHLRSHFGVAFAHIDEAPVLDALLRRTHWLKDHGLDLCMRQVTRGAWWGDAELARDVERRTPDDAARIGEWLAASGTADVLQDERLDRLRNHARDSFPARLRLLRIAARRRRGSSVVLLRSFLTDPDERLARMAAREIVRRRPPDHENALLQLMTNAPDSVRRVISRAVGRTGFEHFWKRFDQLDRPTRKRAGAAMLKLLPDAVQRLQRLLAPGGPLEQTLKAMQVVHELGLAERLKDDVLRLCADPNPKLRSKAVAVAGDAPSVSSELLIDKLLNDADPRVRANAIEVLEARGDPSFLRVLAERARSAHNRERANAIKALSRMRVGAFSAFLQGMLRDARPEHRVSALWALRQIGWWSLLGEVGKLARDDGNLRVRRYALGVLKNVAELAQEQRKGKVG